MALKLTIHDNPPATDALWENAADIADNGESRVWLVWIIGEYKSNKLPSLELRAIYTDRARAIGIARAIQKYETGLSLFELPLLKYTEVLVEPRVLNHHYGGEAMEMQVHMRKPH